MRNSHPFIIINKHADINRKEMKASSSVSTKKSATVPRRWTRPPDADCADRVPASGGQIVDLVAALLHGARCGLLDNDIHAHTIEPPLALRPPIHPFIRPSVTQTPATHTHTHRRN